MSSPAKDLAGESRALHDSIAGMQQAQSEWQNHRGREIHDPLRRHGEAAHISTRVLQHEGILMYDLQGIRIKRTEAETHALFVDKQTRFENTFRASKREERHGVACLREETRGSA